MARVGAGLLQADLVGAGVEVGAEDLLEAGLHLRALGVGGVEGGLDAADVRPAEQ